ncbi:uncharacterized protein RHO25_011564, partial [Cercospora beticola]
PCIDVDARRSGNTIARSFLTDAQARLAWLEDLVKTHIPGIDLEAGPKRPEGEASNVQETPTTGSKRRRSSTANGSEDLSAVFRKARRMALDLGLFSLNTNLSQTHYLGSSSGSFFASLLPEDQHVEHQDGSSEPESDAENVPHRPISPRGSSHTLFSLLKQSLPSRTDCGRMIKLFYDYYHAEYPVLHQPSFAALVDALYAAAEASPSCALQHNGWPDSVRVFSYNGVVGRHDGRDTIAIPIRTAATQIFFVLSIAADLQTRKRIFSADPSRFHAQALALFQLAIAEVSLAAVQSMVLYVLHSFLTAESGNIWVVLHIALAHAIDLGLHRNVTASGRTTETASQMRRRVFFSLYALDRYVSTAQGRPLGFSDNTLDLAAPQIIHDGRAHVQQDQAFLFYSISHFQWAAIISAIKQQLYSFIPHDVPSSTAAELHADLNSRLDQWLQETNAAVEDLPKNTLRRFRTEIKIDYHFAIGLLYQPSRVSRTPSMQALQRCLRSASERLRLYWDLHDQNNLALSWPRTHGIFLAGATLVYCIWSSAEIRSTIVVAELAADLRLCSSLLTLGAEWWPLAQRGRRSFGNLADSTIEFLAGPCGINQHPIAPSATHGASIPIHDQHGLATDSNQWADIEIALQSFLQHEYQLTDMLDVLDASPVDPMNPTWIMPNTW